MSALRPVSSAVCRLPSVIWPLTSRERGCARDRAEKNGDDDGVAGEVVPALDRREILRGGDPDEEESAAAIGEEGNREGGRDQRDPPA